MFPSKARQLDCREFNTRRRPLVSTLGTDEKKKRMEKIQMTQNTHQHNRFPHIYRWCDCNKNNRMKSDVFLTNASELIWWRLTVQMENDLQIRTKATKELLQTKAESVTWPESNWANISQNWRENPQTNRNCLKVSEKTAAVETWGASPGMKPSVWWCLCLPHFRLKLTAKELQPSVEKRKWFMTFFVCPVTFGGRHNL